MNTPLSKLGICLTLPLALTACGGGGGGGGTTSDAATSSITVSNARSVAAAALDATSGVIGATQSGNVFALQANPEPPLSFDLTAFTSELLEGFLPGPAVLQLVTTTTTPCGTGQMTETFNDADNSGDFSSGDSWEFLFQGCGSPGGSIDGLIRFNSVIVDSNAQTGAFSMTWTMEFVAFTIVSGAQSVVYDGTITSSVRVENNVFTYSYSINGTFGSLRGGSTVEYTVGSDGRVSVTSTGSVQLTNGESVRFETTQPFLGDSLTANPELGKCIVYGSGNSQLLISAVDTTNVQLQVDADGNGSYESTIDSTWNELSDL